MSSENLSVLKQKNLLLKKELDSVKKQLKNAEELTAIDIELFNNTKKQLKETKKEFEETKQEFEETKQELEETKKLNQTLSSNNDKIVELFKTTVQSLKDEAQKKLSECETQIENFKSLQQMITNQSIENRSHDQLIQLEELDALTSENHDMLIAIKSNNKQLAKKILERYQNFVKTITIPDTVRFIENVNGLNTINMKIFHQAINGRPYDKLSAEYMKRSHDLKNALFKVLSERQNEYMQEMQEILDAKKRQLSDRMKIVTKTGSFKSLSDKQQASSSTR